MLLFFLFILFYFLSFLLLLLFLATFDCAFSVIFLFLEWRKPAEENVPFCQTLLTTTIKKCSTFRSTETRSDIIITQFWGRRTRPGELNEGDWTYIEIYGYFRLGKVNTWDIWDGRRVDLEVSSLTWHTLFDTQRCKTRLSSPKNSW